MQALVLSQAGSEPVVGVFKEPMANEGEMVVKVLAAALNPVDRYFAANESLEAPRVVGLEGIGEAGDGRRIYFERRGAPFGSVAEKSLAAEDTSIDVPEGLASDAALTLGVSGFAGWLPLSWKAKLQAGESVLVLGATGAQGQVAVQAAKLLGASKVVAAGRNRETLEALKANGADDIVVLEGDIAQAIKQTAPEKGFDVVVDSLFGKPFEALMDSGALHAGSRVVVLGGSAGQEVALNFRQLQGTNGATIAGYSTSFVPKDVKHQAFQTMAAHVLEGKLSIETELFPLDQAAEAWTKQATGPHHKIIVTMT